MLNVDALENDWQTLGSVSIDQLEDTRNQLHHALQVPAAVIRSFVPAKEDDSHTNFGWHHKLNALISHELKNPKKHRIALDFSFTLLIVDQRDHIQSSYSLDGKTLKDSIEWQLSQLDAWSFDRNELSIDRPYEIQDHPTGDGRPFNLNKSTAVEMAKYYANADLVLKAACNNLSNASPVRCWPHHFDLGCLYSLDQKENPEEAKSISVGFSPGDGSYNEPYFYVNPWPYPDPKKITFPKLPSAAHWHKEGWIGAVLTASQIIKESTAKAQAAHVIDYLNHAMKEAESLLT